MKTRTTKSKAPQSEARQSLARLIEAKAELLDSIESLRAASVKLESEINAPAPLEAELRALDIREGAAMSEWAKSGCVDNAPRSDARKREALNKAISTARAGANAASAAHAAITAEHLALHHRLGEMNGPRDNAIVSILVESCDPLIAEFEVENRRLHAKATRLKKCLDLIDRYVDGPTSFASLAFGALVGRLAQTISPPPQDDDLASQSFLAWQALAAGLQSDASTKLEYPK
jgi:hypothetical protein